MTLGTNKLVGTLVGASIAAGGAAAQNAPPVTAHRVLPKGPTAGQLTGGSAQIRTDVFVLPVPGAAASAPAPAPRVRDADDAPGRDFDTAPERVRAIESQRSSPDAAVIAQIVDQVLAARAARTAAPESASPTRTEAIDAQSDTTVLANAVTIALRHLDKPLLAPLLAKLKAQPDFFTPEGPLALSRAFETLTAVATGASIRQWELLPGATRALLDAGARPRRDQVLHFINNTPDATALAGVLQAFADSGVDLKSDPGELTAALRARPFVTHAFVQAQQARGTPALQPTPPRAQVSGEPTEAEQIAQLVNAAVRGDFETWADGLAAIGPSAPFVVTWPGASQPAFAHAAQKSTSAPRTEPPPALKTQVFAAAMQAPPRFLHELIAAAERHARTAQPGRASPPDTWRIGMRPEAEVARLLPHVVAGAPENAERIALLLAAGTPVDRDVAKTLLAQSTTPAALREMAQVLSAQGIDFYSSVSTDWVLAEVPFRLSAIEDITARLAAGGPLAATTPPAFAVRGNGRTESIKERELVVAIRRGDARAFDTALGSNPLVALRSREVADAAVHATDAGPLTKLAALARVRGQSARGLWYALAASPQERLEMLAVLAAVAPVDARSAEPMILAAKSRGALRTVAALLNAHGVSLGTTPVLTALLGKPFDTRDEVARAADALPAPFGRHDADFGESLLDILVKLTSTFDVDLTQPLTNLLPLLEPARFARIGGTAEDAYAVARTLMFAGAEGTITPAAALPILQAALANGCLNADQLKTVDLPGRNPAQARLMSEMAIRFPALVEQLVTSQSVAVNWNDVIQTADGRFSYNVVHVLKYDGSPEALSLARVLESRGVVAWPRFTGRAASPVGLQTSALGVQLRR